MSWEGVERGEGRSLHWERGLKPMLMRYAKKELGRSLHWERGLKLDDDGLRIDPFCRSLHWERGLKLRIMWLLLHHVTSLPSLGAWIETRSGSR